MSFLKSICLFGVAGLFAGLMFYGALAIETLIISFIERKKH